MFNRLLRLKFSSIPKFDSSKDYYSVLGLKKTAQVQEIKAKYYQLAKQFHPDVNNKDDSLFKQINEAYQVLGDEQLKKEYDQTTTGTVSNDQKSGSYYSSYKNDYHYGRTSSNQNQQAYRDFYQQQNSQYYTYHNSRQQHQSKYSHFHKNSQYQQYQYEQGQTSYQRAQEQYNQYQQEEERREQAYEQARKLYEDRNRFQINPQVNVILMLLAGIVTYILIDLTMMAAFGNRDIVLMDQTTGQLYVTKKHEIDEVRRQRRVQLMNERMVDTEIDHQNSRIRP